MKMNVPLNCPSNVIVPERSMLVTRLRFVKITVPLNVAPVWLGIMRDAEKPKNPLFRGFWQLDCVRLPVPLWVLGTSGGIVLTATLVDPRVTPLLSLNRTKIRFEAGSKGTLPVLWTKIEKVLGVANAFIWEITLGPVTEIHCPVTGLVWQRDMFTGKIAPPVSAEAIMLPFAPTFTVATAKAPTPFVRGTLTTPSSVVVAANATMSAKSELEAESSSVLSPVLIGAGFVFEQLKLKRTSVEAIGEFGLKDKTKLWAAPGGMSTGIFGNPMAWFVRGLVVWKLKVAGIAVTKEMPQLVAVTDPALTMVAKAVAKVPTWTERLDGRTAAAIDCAQLEEGAKNKILQVTIIVWQSVITYLLLPWRVPVVSRPRRWKSMVKPLRPAPTPPLSETGK
jgi:hypothetical protein